MSCLPHQENSSCENSASVTLTPHQKTKQNVQSKIVNIAKSTRPLPTSQSKQVDEQIVKFIVKSYHSFAIVEEQEFKNMYKIISPTYSLPTRKRIFSSLVPKLYQSTKENVLLPMVGRR